ncbi:MAG TPA: Stk1 family PASTA domain-containing Ser/Thr kinase [Pseudonocardia sp.]|nr:Stk1 family PASTA domain-containing Ser/Thr kinase [Pseudonocardia sp.]
MGASARGGGGARFDTARGEGAARFDTARGEGRAGRRTGRSGTTGGPRSDVLPATGGPGAPAGGVLLDGRYRVGRMVARGGMSTVHRGTDTRLDRPVAIKMMDPRLASDPAFRTRFEREARSAARIDHPAVVGVHDQGEDFRAGIDGEPVLFLVMELVEGGTLRDVLRARGPVGVPAAFAVMEAVLAGLAEAHRLGLVHRDVKPENVLISRTGEVKVADFGLVTAAARAGLSHAGMILGTVAYLSPEQVETGAADARSDVYAAGIVLYELLTGAPPYTGDHALSVAYRHVNSDVPAPSLVAGDVPPELDELVARATRRDPAGRPADASAFLAELRRVAALLGVPRVPAPVPPPPPVDQQDTVPAGEHRAGARANGTRAFERPPTGVVARAESGAAHVRPRRRRTRGRSRRAFAAWVAVVLVLGMLVATAAWWLGTGRWTEMPRIVGLERAAAERLLVEADLVATVTETYDDEVGAGLVAATDPGPESRLLRGSQVRLTVSTGRPVVPAVAAGTGVAAAEQAVRDAALAPVQNTEAAEYSSSVPAGAVLRTEPAAGTTLPIGSPVTLVLSLGPEPPPPPPPAQVRVPFVIGEEFPDAAEVLAESGLVAEERPAFGFGRERARVIGQSPGAGSMVDPGTTIELSTL